MSCVLLAQGEFAVMVYEEVARFLIWSDEQLRDVTAAQAGLDQFDQVLNLKFLNNVLLTLMELYDEFHQKGEDWHNEVELR